MKKPKWRKYKNEWRRGVLSVIPLLAGYEAYAGNTWLSDHTTPEAAMEAADDWWERTRKRMEGK